MNSKNPKIVLKWPWQIRKKPTQENFKLERKKKKVKQSWNKKEIMSRKNFKWIFFIKEEFKTKKLKIGKKKKKKIQEKTWAHKTENKWKYIIEN
jgi:hypothetical protein